MTTITFEAWTHQIAGKNELQKGVFRCVFASKYFSFIFCHVL